MIELLPEEREPAARLQVLYVGPVVGGNRRLLPGRERWRRDPRYTAFETALAWEIKRGMGICPPWPFPLPRPVALRCRCYLPNLMDLDAPVKPILDALQVAGAVANDLDVELLLFTRIGLGEAEGIAHGRILARGFSLLLLTLS